MNPILSQIIDQAGRSPSDLKILQQLFSAADSSQLKAIVSAANNSLILSLPFTQKSSGKQIALELVLSRYNSDDNYSGN
ncbi:MAG: hypothetical protein V2I33_05110, partial [Kangiellaceae bacterium]|nr:hypothetical protein [Kangiellaceae bacterium]